MQGKPGGANHPPKVFKDVETLKREERQRRRLLRLEQVRQQSKDIANLVRQKVQSEREKQHGLVKERINARTRQWQVRKMKDLQGEYENTLKNVGKGHHDAANLPDAEALRKLESEKILAAAQRRGQEALNRLKEEEAARRKADEERRFQLLNVRSLEEARSAAVVALPRPESTVGLKSILSKPPVCTDISPGKSSGQPVVSKASKPTMPEWPKRSWPQPSLPLGIVSTEYDHEQGDHVEVEEKEGDHDIVHKLTTTARVSSHGDSSRVAKSLLENQSEQANESTKPTSVRNPSTLTSNADVKLFDYSSCYQSQCKKAAGVVEKVQGNGKINAKEAADREISAGISHNKPNKRDTQREQQRSREALMRVQAQHDYRDLMGSLSQLAKQNAALCSYNNVPEMPWVKVKGQPKEDRLKLAVENLLCGSQENISGSFSDSYSADTPDGSLVVSHLGETPGSAPKLNVGRWQLPQSAQSSSPKADASSTPSIILAQPPRLPLSANNVREENFERDAALRSLVRRINEERQNLLLSSQHSLDPSQATYQEREYRADKEMDIQLLEEKVMQQRQQLKIQRSEVKRLDASIVVPDCMNMSQDKPERTSLSSSLTHESITIEPSLSDKSEDLSTSSTPEKRKSNKKRKSLISSPVKDVTMYSMDLSMSSVIMDQTESSSSGSKSLCLHGVQVLVKVCGTGEDTSEGRSGDFSEEGRGVTVTELSSDSDRIDVEHAVMKKSSRSEDEKNAVDLKQRSKGKTKSGNETCQARLSKSAPKTHLKVSQKDKSIPNKVEGRKKTASTDDYQTPKIAIEKHNNVCFDKNLKKEKKISKLKHKKKVAEIEKLDQPTSTSTSYLSPPDRVLSSLTEDIKTLIALAQRNVQPQSESQTGQEQNLPLVRYINRLLAMSRESIDRLNVSCSDVSTPPSTIFQSFITGTANEPNLTDIGFGKPLQDQTVMSHNASQDQVDQPVYPLQSISGDLDNQERAPEAKADQWLLQSASNEQETLTDMTKQCHEKISALTKMIEEVRRQAAANSPISNDSDGSFLTHNQSRSSLPLDSTAYMSPPPHLLEWADIALPFLSQEDRENRLSLDPYSAAVLQLLADVRSEMTSNVTEPSEPPQTTCQRTPPQGENREINVHVDPGFTRPKPPVAFWRNIERCNVTSPTEPHELSTIHELGTTLPESIGSRDTAPTSPIHALSPPSTPGTPPDVISELMRRKLLTSPFAWAKKMEEPSHSSELSLKNSKDSDLSSGKTGTGRSDISASKETNTLSFQSRSSNSNGSRGWKTNTLMSPIDLYSSADEVEGDFRRMGIGWVGAMLRKTKEAGALSSTSSSDGVPIYIENSDFKNISEVTDEEPILSSSLTVALRQERSHSTPIKEPSEFSSSGGSRLV